MTATRDDLQATIRRLVTHGESSDWLGPDPYEAMNATRIVGPLKRTPMGRRLLLQLVKRSPLNLRPVLGITPTPNSATAAFVVAAYAKGGTPETDDAGKLRAAVDRLLALRSPQFDEPCWGYQFATQSRVVFYDKFEPSTVATTVAALALLDAYDRLGEDRMLEAAAGAGRFFLRHVPQTGDEPGAYFGYLVDDRTPIHNSNVHACSVLARLTTHVDEPSWREAARRGVQWTLARQRPDGSWPYGEQDNLAWVDNFHTAYVLESLRICADAGLDDRIEDAWKRGLDYFRERLFLADGTPKYYSDETYPIDGQCVAEAIRTLAIASRHEPDCLDHAWQVFGWALEHMRRRDGLFYFQRRRHWVNPVPHMRWVQAPMLGALLELREADAERRSGGDADADAVRSGAAGDR
jgi:hypothetical protein